MNKIKVGLIGCGKISDSHLKAYQSFDDAEILAVADVIEEKAQSAKEKYGADYSYTDYHDMLNNEEIEAVDVCTHTPLHAEITINALNKGKHVLVEKPMATSLEKADEMIRASEKNGKILMVEQALRFNAVFETLKSVLEKGLIGEIYSMQCISGHTGPMDWNPDAEWFLRKKTGGGVALDMGIHEADLLRWSTGKEVKEVGGFIENLKKGSDTEDNMVSILKFEDKTLATMTISWTLKRGERVLTVFGTEGHLYLNTTAEHVITIFQSKEKKTIYPEIPKHSKYGPGRAYRHFINCIQGKEKCICPGEEGRRSLEVVLAACKSSETGKIVSLPLKV